MTAPDPSPVSSVERGAAFWFGLAAAWSILIFLTVPYAPKITGALTEWLNDRLAIDWGYSLIGHMAAALLALVLAAAAWRLRAHPAWRIPARLLVVFAVLAAYAVLLSRMEIAAEKIHFLQYGLLAWLAWRGWRITTPSSACWALAFFTGALVGVLDEFLQYLTPGRHGEAVDAVWNVLAAALPLLLVAVFARPASGGAIRSSPPSPRDLSLVRAFGLGFVAAFLGFVLFTQEYGTRLVGDGFVFRTRLADAEALRAAPPPTDDVIAELRVQTPYLYGRFLERHPADREPHLNEFRVHLYRRDRYLGQAGHALLRRSVARGAGADVAKSLEAMSSPEDVALVTALQHPVAARALRAYAAHYLGDERLRAIYGADPASDTVATPMRAWIDGTDSGWGEPLWSAYLATHAAKAAAEAPPEIERVRDHLHVAWSEHRILEAAFGRLLAASGERWPADLEDAAWAATRDRGVYHSAVAERVLDRTWRSYAAIIAALLVGVLLFRPSVFTAGIHALILVIVAAHLLLSGYYAAEVLAFGRAAPRAEPTIRLASAPAPPTLDGRPGPGEYGDAPNPLWPASLTDTGRRTGEVASPEAWVFLAATPADLWVAFRVRDSDVVALQSAPDAELWRDDCVEIFLDTAGTGRGYVEIQVNPSGLVTDAFISWSRAIDFASAVSWTAAGMEVRTAREPEGWTAEIRIPWRSIGMTGPPSAGAALRANFTRIDRDATEPPLYRYSAWSPTDGWFHRPIRFGRVEGAS